MRMGAVPAPVSFLDTTENFAHYARDSYAKLIVAEDHLLERLPAGTMSRTAFEERLRTHEGLDRPGRRPRRRHGLLAVQRRLDRLPQGRRAPAPRHPLHLRDVRQGDPPDHRPRRHVQLDQALPRVRAGQQPDVPVLGRRDHGAADGQARPARPAGDRAGAATQPVLQRPHALRRDGQPAGRRRLRPQLRPVLRERRRAAGPRGLPPLEGRVRPRHRRRHRLDRDAAHLLLQPAG